jgi:hypothetical protein
VSTRNVYYAVVGAAGAFFAASIFSGIVFEPISTGEPASQLAVALVVVVSAVVGGRSGWLHAGRHRRHGRL